MRHAMLPLKAILWRINIFQATMNRLIRSCKINLRRYPTDRSCSSPDTVGARMVAGASWQSVRAVLQKRIGRDQNCSTASLRQQERIRSLLRPSSRECAPSGGAAASIVVSSAIDSATEDRRHGDGSSGLICSRIPDHISRGMVRCSTPATKRHDHDLVERGDEGKQRARDHTWQDQRHGDLEEGCNSARRRDSKPPA